jgi:hypothetical protein
MENFFH